MTSLKLMPAIVLVTSMLTFFKLNWEALRGHSWVHKMRDNQVIVCFRLSTTWATMLFLLPLVASTIETAKVMKRNDLMVTELQKSCKYVHLNLGWVRYNYGIERLFIEINVVVNIAMFKKRGLLVKRVYAQCIDIESYFVNRDKRRGGGTPILVWNRVSMNYFLNFVCSLLWSTCTRINYGNAHSVSALAHFAGTFRSFSAPLIFSWMFQIIANIK